MTAFDVIKYSRKYRALAVAREVIGVSVIYIGVG